MPGQFEAPMAKAVPDFAQTELTAGNPFVANLDQNAADSLLLRAKFQEQQTIQAQQAAERRSHIPEAPSRPRVESRDRVDPPLYNFESLMASVRADLDGYRAAMDAQPRIEWQRPPETPQPEAPREKRYRDEISRQASHLSRPDRNALVQRLNNLAGTSDTRLRPDLAELFRTQAANIGAGGRLPPRRRERPQPVAPGEQGDGPGIQVDALEVQGQEVVLTAEQIQQELIRIRIEAEAVGRADFVPKADEVEGLKDEVVHQVRAEIQKGQQQVDGNQLPVQYDRISTQILSIEAPSDTEAERVFALSKIHSDETITTDEQGNTISKKLTPEDLKERGLLPKHKIIMGGREVWMSDPYKLDEGRIAVVGYLSDDQGKFVARSFYRSNSQGSWRYLPHHTYTWYGKGYSEDSVNLPFQMQEVLANISQDESTHKVVENPDFVLLGTARYNPKLLYPLEVQKQIDATNAQIGALDSTHPDSVDKETQLRIKINKLTSLKAIADKRNTMKLVVGKAPEKLEGNFYQVAGKTKPEDIQFTNPNQKPNFAIRPPMSWVQNTSLYGQVTAEVYPSQDGRLNYLVFKDLKGRVWIGGIEDTQSPVTRVGVREKWIDGGDLTTPAYEYDDQTGGYENKADINKGYVDMSVNYLSHVPIIQEYHSLEATRNKVVPPVPAPILPPKPPTAPRTLPSSPQPLPSSPDAKSPVAPKAPEFHFDPAKSLSDQIGSEIARSGVVNLHEGAAGIQSMLRSLLGQGGTLDGRFTQGGFDFAGQNLMIEGMEVNISGTLIQMSIGNTGADDYLSLKNLQINPVQSGFINLAKAGIAKNTLEGTDTLERRIRDKLNEELKNQNSGASIDSIHLSLDLGAQVLRGTIKGRPVGIT